jgi:hypothetical protein
VLLLGLVAVAACADLRVPSATPPTPKAARIECPAGRGDCDGDPANGCEADLESDADHCHVCGHSCRGAHAAVGCFDGACRLLGCDPGYGDCDHLAENGCEAELCYTSQGWRCPGRCGGGFGMF